MARGVILLLALLFIRSLSALTIYDGYRSPRNPERKVRSSTRLIVLHTTEAPARSSLNKVSDRGECHFCVTEEGRIYRIVDRDREAFHAGRSMWCGAEDVDKYSVGIECVGYHNKSMSLVQLYAIRDLIRELKAMYRLSDEKVLAHSHVAYGAPNRWQKRRHRGRKRCGMLFAMSSVRRILELRSKPTYDPDTRAGRLIVGDEYLRNVLYGGVDTMRSTYGSQTVVKAHVSAPRSKSNAQAASSVKRMPVRLPRNISELKAQGYVFRGVVSKTMTAKMLVGDKWNLPTTLYLIRNKIIPGSAIDPSKIEKGTFVWTKK